MRSRRVVSSTASSPPSRAPLSTTPLVLHSTRPGPWTLLWQVVIGAGLLMLLAGLTLFAIAALRRRRARAARAVRDDKAA